MPEITHLLWLDLETTGTDETLDPILEVGWIVTPIAAPWKTLAEGEVILPLVAAVIDRLAANQYVYKMHADSGLLAACSSQIDGRDYRSHLTDAALSIVGVAHTYAQSHGVVLAGSGVSHFDRRFLKAQMPVLEKFLAYPNLDIGVVRRFVGMVRPDLVPTLNSEKPHRALADVRLHREEARHYTLMLGQVRHPLLSALDRLPDAQNP